MSTYVIGDVQGCYDELQALLKLLKFDIAKDELWFTGDLVNRGPKSLQVLRFVHQLTRVVCVLGNHDLMLLALAYTQLDITHHTLDPILTAPDREILLTWLRQRPLIYQPNHSSAVLVHAGIPPQWTLAQAKIYAHEVELILQGENHQQLLSNMFGNSPHRWHNNLTGWPRYRFIINGLTRMRFCKPDGTIDLSYKGKVSSAPDDLMPWFKVPNRAAKNENILFGHWAALEGKTNEPNTVALDMGCVWGGSLTALRLEDNKKFSINC